MNLKPRARIFRRKLVSAVEGLLEGDSFHLVLGDVGNEFGLVGDTLSVNGLGPYGQSEVWSLSNAALGMEVSGAYALEKRGYVSRITEGFNYFDQVDPESWSTVQADSATSNITFTQWSWDGQYEMYLPSGEYILQVIPWSSQRNVAFNVSSSKIASPGESLMGLDSIMERSEIPIQEFNTTTALTTVTIAAVLIVGPRKAIRSSKNR